jgi:hypothetical protein
MPFCDQCGERISEQARFCPSCGARRWTPEEAASAPPAPEVETPRVEEPETPRVEEPPAPEPEQPPVEEPPKSRVWGAAAIPEEPVQEEPPAAEEPAPEPPRRAWAAAAPPPPPPPPAAEAEEPPPARAPRPEEELYAALGAQLRTPPVVSAAIIGAGALGVCFVVALVLAALPDRSLIGFLGNDATYLEETFRQMCQLVLAGFENDALFDVFRQTDRVAPLVFALVPFGATFLLARNQRPRLHTLPFWPRLAWAAAGGLLFALLMLIPSLLTGDVDADSGQVFGYSLLWGVLGSVSGTFAVSPEGRERAGTVHSRLPESARIALAASWTALKPLGIALIVTSVIGTALWLVQVATVEQSRGSRSLPIALIDTALYGADHGVHTFQLGTLAAFDGGAGLTPPDLNLPLPAQDPAEILRQAGASYTIFGYREGTSALVFLLMLVVLVVIPVGGALLAGFLVARERAATEPLKAAAWGAIVGPVWAIAMAILGGLVQDTLYGHAQGESVFGLVLVGGALVGALGGFLAAQAAASSAPAPATATGAAGPGGPPQTPAGPPG